MQRDSRPGRPETVETVDAAATSGPAGTVPVVAAETETEKALTGAFGPVTRWWVGPVPGLGVMRLPLP